MAIAINSAKRSGSEQPVIRFELTAMVRAADLNGMAENDWYTAGHDAIVNGFVELTTLEAQEKHWHRIS